MAQVVGAFGCSHGPLLSTKPDQWGQRAAADERNPRHFYRGDAYDYSALLKQREGAFEGAIALAEKTERYDACQSAIDELSRRYVACGANAAIILGNDQRELFKDDFTPAFLVYAGETIENLYPGPDEQKRLDSMGLLVAVEGHVPVESARYAGSPAIARALVDGLIARDFDIAVSTKLPEPGGHPHGIPHAFGFVLHRIMHDQPPPTVPIFLNVGEQNNQPRLQRLLDFGHALKRTIDALPADLNIALFTSGGFTHFTVDEAFDRDVIAAMESGDEARLAAFPESWFWGNTCETKSWYPMVAAMNDFGRKMDVIDYVPCYRTPAGTGQGMIFASWE